MASGFYWPGLGVLLGSFWVVVFLYTLDHVDDNYKEWCEISLYFLPTCTLLLPMLNALCVQSANSEMPAIV